MPGHGRAGIGDRKVIYSSTALTSLHLGPGLQQAIPGLQVSELSHHQWSVRSLPAQACSLAAAAIDADDDAYCLAFDI